MKAFTIKLILLVLVFHAGSVLSEPEDKKKYKLSESTHKSLTAIHELMNQGDNEKALTSLQTVLKKTNDREYDRAVIYQTLGYVYNSLGKYD